MAKKPLILKVRGDEYRAVVTKVVGRDQQGRPRSLDVLYDEESTDIQGGEEFLVVFVKSDCIRKTRN